MCSDRSAKRMQRGRKRRESGQAIVESCFAILLSCLIFFGLFQISQWLAAREVLHHAAARGARARTVGFNRWMVTKAVRVAAIPNAGLMLEPAYVNEDLSLRAMVNMLSAGAIWESAVRSAPGSPQYHIERARIPEYIASENQGQARYILDYEGWQDLQISVSETHLVDTNGHAFLNPVGSVRVRQNYANWVPMHRTFYASDRIRLAGESYLENYYPLYIDDRGW